MSPTATTSSIALEDLTALRTPVARTEQRPDIAITNATTDSRLADEGAPEGGYGWIVIFAVASINFFTTGTVYSWGVIQTAILKDNKDVSASTLAFVGSLWTAWGGIPAFVSARILRLLGARLSAIVGILLLGIGEIVSSFSVDHIGALFVTTGFLMGSATGLCYLVVSVIPSQYFAKKRGLANGIVLGSAGIGGAVITLMMNGLVERLGISWAYRITGFVTIGIGIPVACLIKERAAIRPSGLIDWSLVREFPFIMFFLAGAIAIFSVMVAPFFLPLYSDSVGLSSGTGAALVAAFTLASGVGRLGFGFLCDLGGPVNMLFATQILGGISMMSIWTMADSLAPLAIFAVVNGMANGGFFSVMPTVIGNVFGSSRVSVALGMCLTSWTAGYLMGAPIAAYLLDAYGGSDSTLNAYHPAMFYAGSLSIGSAAFVLMARFKLNRSLLAKV